MVDDGLTPPSLIEDAACLGRVDADLARLIEQIGLPRYPQRPQGFVTLLTLILEQQVSTASALAVRDRLLEHQPLLTAQNFAAIADGELRAFGFSRQKAAYARALAAAILDRSFVPEALPELPDEAVMTALTGLKGIGRWTAEIYRLFALGHRDVWPAGDLAIQVACGRLKQLPARPDEAQTRSIAEAWRPWRSSAAVLLWHQYLADRRERQSAKKPRGTTTPGP